MSLLDRLIGNTSHPLNFGQKRDLNGWMQKTSICGFQLRCIYWLHVTDELTPT
jgi:hypothetical protein